MLARMGGAALERLEKGKSKLHPEIDKLASEIKDELKSSKRMMSELSAKLRAFLIGRAHGEVLTAARAMGITAKGTGALGKEELVHKILEAKFVVLASGGAASGSAVKLE